MPFLFFSKTLSLWNMYSYIFAFETVRPCTFHYWDSIRFPCRPISSSILQLSKNQINVVTLLMYLRFKGVREREKEKEREREKRTDFKALKESFSSFTAQLSLRHGKPMCLQIKERIGKGNRKGGLGRRRNNPPLPLSFPISFPPSTLPHTTLCSNLSDYGAGQHWNALPPLHVLARGHSV